MAHIELLDPFGSILAEGEIAVREVLGIDPSTPSSAEEFAQRIAGRRLNLQAPEDYMPPGPYSIRVS